MTEEIKNTPASIESPAEQTKTASALAQAMPHHHRRVLFEWTVHPHVPRNVNLVYKAEQAAAGFNTRFAVDLTKHTGTMWTAYLFAGIGIGSLVGVFTNNVFLGLLLVQSLATSCN